ncbi:hypothetical protein [Arthrobacter sp. ISL-72]|uniref:hypothetical protein n=1 Tax=Arthrobacter sp. ISL-72 TaxID=2819114 RepID=UPI0037BFBE0C
MGKLTVLALRIILGAGLAGSLFVQAVMVPLLARDLNEDMGRAFRYVDVVAGAVAAASLLTFGLGVVLAPGESVAPGIVLLIGGAGVLVAGWPWSSLYCARCWRRRWPATPKPSTCRANWTR